MTTITIDRAVMEQALEALEAMNPYPASKEDQRAGALTALRAALAQQAEPQGCATEEDCTKQPWCRIRGECQRKQAEPVEPVATLTAQRDALLEALRALVRNEGLDAYSHLDKGIGTATAAGQRWLNARAAIKAVEEGR